MLSDIKDKNDRRPKNKKFVINPAVKTTER